MSRYSVDLDRLQEFADRLAAFNSSAEHVAGEAEQQVAVLHSSWTGDAADAHRRYHTEWMDAVSQMREALNALRTKIASAHRDYSGTVAHNVAMWP
ncbi:MULTISPECIES: WXG100 family type VII secretion target [unclassified Mycobacterium]|uniref:WXG100 family type VII secretion target n=1 Tax=unclassified Mycobacterium TaxID=2642494 RepID=UPI0007FBC751|nr:MULTISPECIES: WXG100 family type VII secretion target [unclassified Mycobacterium]OBG80391.1 hypothetical protein A5699_11180 [Mycobacterium sp. E802]